MKSTHIAFLAALSLFFIVGCSSVSFKHPLSPTKVSEKQQHDLQGAWIFNKSVFQLEFQGDAKADIATIYRKDDKFKLETGEAYFTRLGEKDYMSIRFKYDDKQWGDYFIFRYTVVDENLVLWAPNAEKFKELVRENTIFGEINETETDTDIIVSSGSETLTNLFKLEGKIKYDYEDPLVFKHIVKSSVSNKPK